MTKEEMEVFLKERKLINGWKPEQGEGFVPYLECGPGWNDLIASLIDDLIALGWDRHVHQIKEKFGGLRFYIGAESTEMSERINRAEHESFNICEMCGKPAEDHSVRGWITTLCPEHLAEYKKERGVDD